MSATNLDAFDLDSVADNGLIKEDVMAKIWDISKIPLPFTDMMSSDTIGNQYAEWTQDELQAVDIGNAFIDGEDLTQDNTSVGDRVGNHAQISTKRVAVSTRANAVNTIGFANTLSYQVMMRQQELRRDVEAIMTGEQASIAGTSVVAGRSAGFGAWLTTNTLRGVGGLDGGYGTTSPQIVDTPTVGTVEELTETRLRDVLQSVYLEGGNPTKLMTTVQITRLISEYMFTGNARIASPVAEFGQSIAPGVAKGAVNVFVTDFGVTVEFIANRLMDDPTPGSGVLYILDPEFIRQGFLHGYRVEPQAKTGLSEKRQMIVDWTLKVLTEKAHGSISDIDYSTAMVP